MNNHQINEFVKTIAIAVILLLINVSSAFAKNVFFIGHSLTDFNLPYMVSHLARSAGYKHDWKFQIIIGSPLKWNWQNAHRIKGDQFSLNSRDAVRGLPSGRFDSLVLTPSGRIPDHLRWSESHVYASKFFALALQNNLHAEAYIYQVWPSLDPKYWQESNWENEIEVGLYGDQKSAGMGKLGLVGMAAWIDKKLHAQRPVKIIPAALAMRSLKKTIERREIPGLNAITDLFDDDIHLNKLGNYFIACVHFSSIYNRSPVGLRNTIPDLYNRSLMYFKVQKDIAVKFQKIAWETVQSFNVNYEKTLKLKQYDFELNALNSN